MSIHPKSEEKLFPKNTRLMNKRCFYTAGQKFIFRCYQLTESFHNLLNLCSKQFSVASRPSFDMIPPPFWIKPIRSGYMATLVACRWAGAVLEKVTRASVQEPYAQKRRKVKRGPTNWTTDRSTDRPTDRPTDIAGCWVAQHATKKRWLAIVPLQARLLCLSKQQPA